MAQANASTPEERAHKRAKSYTSLLWHIGAFIVINGFFWILDLLTGEEAAALAGEAEGGRIGHGAGPSAERVPPKGVGRGVLRP